MFGPIIRSSQLDLRSLERHQINTASRVVVEDDFCTDVVAGVDQAFIRSDDCDADEKIISGAVALNSSQDVVSSSSSSGPLSFPYIPGLLSFREGPAAIRASAGLKPRPTLLFVDGCGINHPRHAGLASYIGVILDVPTIGITKNVLCGSFEPPEKVGDASLLIFEGEEVGHVFLSKKGCRPIVVAPGHRLSIKSSLDLANKYLRGHKLPEPCRRWHMNMSTPLRFR
jgi:deoxyribonuclease V